MSILSRLRNQQIKSDVSVEYIAQLIHSPDSWSKVVSRYIGAWIVRIPIGTQVILNRISIGTAVTGNDILLCTHQGIRFVSRDELSEYVDDISAVSLIDEWQPIRMPIIKGELYSIYVPRNVNDLKQICHAAVTDNSNSADCYITARSVSDLDTWVLWDPKNFKETFVTVASQSSDYSCSFPSMPDPVIIMKGVYFLKYC